MNIAILCGGPSFERGISLNSARSVMDHLGSRDFDVAPFYFDEQKRVFPISKTQLYSNTPSDFDFKLAHTTAPLATAAFVRALRAVDIVFPVMHGAYGEDGGIQRFLEKHRIPFVGSSSETCSLIFDKYDVNEHIKKLGFYALSSIVLKIYHNDHQTLVQKFFKQHRITRAAVKPARGGSSIGVFSVSTQREALEKARLIFSKRMDTRVVVEPFAIGREFTVIIIQNRYGLPVAVLPTEIETDYAEHQIFDFRRKYLPTRQVAYHCPPRFSNETIERIQVQAEQLFAALKMRDFGRFDGWVLEDGNIWFSDFNPISGMEQNSFLFQQASRIGMSHADILEHILNTACARYGIPLTRSSATHAAGRKPVHVLFGGATSERQVSLMSGTNVWLKLRGSTHYEPKPFLLDTKGSVWGVPYQLALNHTVEEIEKNCRSARASEERLGVLERKVRLRLGLHADFHRGEFGDPKRLSLREFIQQSEFVFIALHGGMGENGTLQKMLSARKVRYNGSDARVSALCIDKWSTGRFMRTLALPGVDAIPGKMAGVSALHALKNDDYRDYWGSLRRELGARSIVVKPRADGCSSGVVHLYSHRDLARYLRILKSGAHYVPKHAFRGQSSRIEMPAEEPEHLLFEKFIETDTIRVRGNALKHHKKTGWIEVTVGVLEERGTLRAFNPSITVAEGEVLSVEEKFQGGTGINITPPPEAIVKCKVLERAKSLIQKTAQEMGIKGYARIDAFLHRVTGDLLIIEVNTLPGLTPSTVFFHQALAENPPIYPRELIEMLIKNKDY